MNKPTLGNTIIGTLGLAAFGIFVAVCITAYAALICKACTLVWRAIV